MHQDSNTEIRREHIAGEMSEIMDEITAMMDDGMQSGGRAGGMGASDMMKRMAEMHKTMPRTTGAPQPQEGVAA